MAPSPVALGSGASASRASVRSTPGTSAPGGRRAASAALLAPLVVGVLATALYCALSWSQWLRWDVPSWDNAIFTQLLSSYTSGDGARVDLKGHGFNLLGDHFHPLLAVLAPVYALFPSALTPMVVQDVLLGISVVVVTRCAGRVLPWAPAAAVGLAYALSFGLQNAVAVQFHEVALAVPLLALSLSAWQRGRHRAAVLWAAPVALVKEDLGITVAVIGVLVLGRAVHPFLRRWAPVARRRLAWTLTQLQHPAQPAQHHQAAQLGQTERLHQAPQLQPTARPPHCTLGQGQGQDPEPALERREGDVVVLDRAQWRHDVRVLRRDPAPWWGAALVVWGVLVSGLAVGVVLPALNPAGEFAYADKLEPGGFLRDPASALILLVVPAQKLVTWLLLLVSGAVVAVRSPVVLVALPTLVWRMLSPNEGYWGSGWHYSAVLMPVVFVALVDAVARLRGDADRARRRTAPAARSLARFDGPVLGVLAGAAPWVALTVAVLVTTAQPLAQLATPQTWQTDPRAQVKSAAVERIPRGAAVATDLSLLNALVSRADVHWIGNGEDPAPEHVLVDRAGATWGGAPPEDVAAYAHDVYGASYAVVSDEENIVVARRSS